MSPNFFSKYINKQFLLTSLMLVIGLFLYANPSSAATSTEFIAIVDPDNATGTSYTSLSAWEAAVQSDLTATSTLVFSFDPSLYSGNMADALSINGETSGASGTLIHLASSTFSNQALVKNITGEFENGEKIYVVGASSNYVYINATGTMAIAVAQCRSTGGTADVTAVTISGWTTSEDDYVKIWTDPTDIYGRHSGKWDDDKYSLEISDDLGKALYIMTDYVHVDGLQVYWANPGTDDTGWGIYMDGNVNKVSNNIVRIHKNHAFGLVKGITVVDSASSDIDYIWNNIVIGEGGDNTAYGKNGITVEGLTSGTVYLINNTVSDTTVAYTQSQNKDVIIINSIALDSDSVDFTGTFDASSGYNISSDATAPGSNSQANTTVKFENAAAGNLILKQSDTVARDMGTSSVLSTIPELAYDIQGTPRGGAIDIGADELPVEFESTICENAAAGGDCANMDYSSLSTWEDKVETDLTATTTRVFSGSITGTLAENTAVNLCNGASDINIDGVVVATTSDQILIDGITGTVSALITVSGYSWQSAACSGSATNEWVISGTGDGLGASAMAVAKIDGAWTAPDTAELTIYDWDTDIDNSIKIYTTGDAKHNGIAGSGYISSTSDTVNIVIRESNVDLEGVEVTGVKSAVFSGIQIGAWESIENISVSGCLVHDIYYSHDSAGIRITGGGSDTCYLDNIKIYNNILYNIDGSGIHRNIAILEEGTGGRIYNNTVFNCNLQNNSFRGGITNFSSDIDFVLVNNIAFNNGDEDYDVGGSTNNGSQNNASSDTTGNTGLQNMTASDHFVNLTAGSEDLHLLETSSLIDVGVNLSSTSTLSVVDDIDSAPRNSDDLGYDIGADEVAAKQYRSVGNTTGNISNSATVTISSTTRLATFSAPQPNYVGVGDVIQYGNAGAYELAFITSRASSTEYGVQSYDTKAPSATTTAAMNIYRAHLLLDDWEDQLTADVNADIDADLRGQVLVNMDLVASNTVMMVAAYGSSAGDTEPVTIGGWTTGVQNYVNIYTPVTSSEVGVSQRHKGKEGNNGDHYRLVASHAMYILDVNIWIDGLEINNNNDSSSAVDCRWGNGTADDKIVIKNNIIYNSASYLILTIRFEGSTYSSFQIYNNIIYDGLRGIVSDCDGDPDTIHVYNNTIYDCSSYGIVNSNSGGYFFNNIVSNSEIADYYQLGGAVVNNNISSDGSADNWGGTGHVIDAKVKFIDESNKNFHLSPSDTNAIDAGTSTVETQSIASLQYDIDGNYRRTFDIGADEASIDFVTTIMEGGLGDFSTLSSWEDTIESDIAATSTAVFSTTGKTGTFTQGVSYVGATSNASGTLVHIGSTTDQVLLVNVQGTFIAGETVTDGSASFVLEDIGNPVNAVAEIDGVWSEVDTTYIDVDGWETGANNTIRIYTTDIARHNGKWSDDAYTIFYENNYVLIRISEDYTVIDGLQFRKDTNNAPIGIYMQANYSVVSNSIVWSRNKSDFGNGYGIGIGYDRKGNKVYNNIIYGFGGNSNGGIYLQRGVNYIFNNTLIDNKYGMYQVNASNEPVVANNIAFDSEVNDYLLSGYSSGYNNISSDGSAPGTNSMTTTTVTFLDATNNDFRLSPTDTTARNAGTTSVATDVASLVYDIQGTLRGANWDIGADEVTTEYISTICENTSAGGDCANMDYSTLSTWEDAVEVDLTATTTRVFSGTLTGTLNENADITLYENGAITSITATVVATTSDQILIDNIDVGTASATDAVIVNGQLLSVGASSVWQLDASNYWTMTSATTSDLLGASPMAVAKIDGAWSVADTATVIINHWDTDVDNLIRIYTTNLARHNGVWNDTKYRIENSSATGILEYEENIKIEGLQIHSDTSTGIRFLPLGIANIEFFNNIVKGNNVAWESAVRITDGQLGSVVKIWNNFIYNQTSVNDGSAIYSQKEEPKYYYYNNTIFNCDRGIVFNASVIIVATNNLIASTTDPFNGTFHASSTHNATDTTDPVDGSSNTHITNATFNFVSTTPGAEDFHLQKTSTDVIDAGYDLSNDPYLSITNDIDGNTRPFNNTFDIGADEYALYTIYRSNGPSNTSILQDDNTSADTLTISSDGTATFSADIIDTIGVGDAIVYDSDGDNDIDGDDSIVFISSRASSTEYTVQDEDGTTPDNLVTTEEDWSIFRAYTSLNSAERGTINTGISALGISYDADLTANGGRDLVTNNEQWNIACYGDAVDTTDAVINGWDTGVQNYIKIYTPVDLDEVGITQRHNGVWDVNAYHLVAESYFGTIFLQDDYVRFIGLQIQNSGDGETGGPEAGIYNSDNDGKELYFINNIIREIGKEGSTASGLLNNAGIYVYFSGDVSMFAYNNIIYGFRRGFRLRDAGGTEQKNMFIYNNTVKSNKTDYAISAYSTNNYIFLKNNISQGPVAGFSFADIVENYEYSNNISLDATAPGTNSKINTTVKFIDETNKNFHLSPSDTAAIDQGTSSVAVGGSGITGALRDIDGNYRRTFDIGADEASIDFVTTIMEGDLGDFTTLSTWEDTIESDIAATSTAVFSTTGKTGTFTQGVSFVGATSNASGTLVHIGSTTDQVLLVNVQGTFIAGETVTDGSASFVLEDIGNPVNAVAKIDGVWSSPDTTAVRIDDWTTGANNYIRVYTTDIARHKGKWDDERYRLEDSIAGDILRSDMDYTVIEGLQIYHTGLSYFAVQIVGTENTFKNNIVKRTTSGSAGQGVNFYVDQGVGYAYNNISYGASGASSYGLAGRGDTSYYYFYNNTVYNCGDGLAVSSGSTVLAKNNIVNGVISDGYSTSAGTFDILSNYNISSDGTAPGTNSQINTTVTFLDVANNDFRLSPTDTSARNAGTSTPKNTDSNTIYDIQGTMRGANWDIGADEVTTEYVSTICENTSAGGDCADMDYSTLSTWEDKVEVDLTTPTTRVFSGSITGVLDENNTVTLYESGAITSITADVVASTSDQILLDNIDVGIASATDATIVNGQLLSVGASSVWLKDASNYWTMTSTTTDDMLGASPIAVAKIDGSWSADDTDVLLISSWGTDMDNYIKIYTTDMSRHGGSWDDTKYRLVHDATKGYDVVIGQKVGNIRYEGLQLELNTNDYSSGRGCIAVYQEFTTEGETYITNNLMNVNFSTTDSDSYESGLYLSADVVDYYVTNNVIRFSGSGYSGANPTAINFANSKGYVFNNTVIGFNRGILSYVSGAVLLINNIVASGTNPFAATFHASSTHNATDGTDVVDGSSNTHITNATFNFVSTTPGSEDFHLLDSDTAAKDAGYDLSNDWWAITDSSGGTGALRDIDGAPRNPDDLGYDIGADELAAKQYRSVGNDATDLANAATVTISSTTRLATFSAPQPNYVGVGDVIQYGNAGAYELAFIISRASSTEYGVQAYDTKAPSATTTASFAIYRAHLLLDDWEEQTAGQVNSSIDPDVESLVLVSQDLVASNTQLMIAAYAATDPDNQFVSISDWVSSENNYLKIYTPSSINEVGVSQRHNGVWDDSKYRLAYDRETYTSAVVNITGSEQMAIILDGLQIKNTTDTWGIYGIRASYYNGKNSTLVISNNIVVDESGDVNAMGIGAGTDGDSDVDKYVYNNIVYNAPLEGIAAYTYKAGGADGLHFTANNTIYNCGSTGGYAFRVISSTDSSYSYVYNNIAYNKYGTDYNFTSDEYANNLSFDDTAPGTSFDNQEVLFIDEHNLDLHLNENSPGVEQGTSTFLTNENLWSYVRDDIQYDIDGQLRRDWDIGADEATHDFVTTVMEGGLGDFGTLSTWEDTIESDIVATSTAVFGTTGKTGTFTQGVSFVGQTSNATGTLIHIGSTTDQVLLVNIEGDFTNGETVTDGSASFVLSDIGNPVNAVAKIDGLWSGADTTAVDINGWETGVNNYIRIYTTDIARHKGKWDDLKYVLYSDALGAQLIDINEGYVKIDGLQIYLGSQIFDQNGINIYDNGYFDISLSNNIIKGSNSTVHALGINVGFSAIQNKSAEKLYIYNNIIYDIGSTHASASGIGQSGSYGNLYIYNNTISNASRGIREISAGVVGSRYIVNNIVQNCATAYVLDSAFDQFANNIANDGTVIGDSSFASTTVTFLDAANNDFRLSPTDTTARNAGTSTPKNTNSNTIYDIQGTLRGANWDIGADEVTTEYISTICENTSAGGDCADMDYKTLATWEDAVEVDLTATTTRIFSGTITGALGGNVMVTLYENGNITSITADVVATTSDQILLDNIDAGTASATDAVIVNGQLLSVGASSVWQKDGSNYWTMTSATTSDLLGASPVMVAKIDGAWAGAETGGLILSNSTTDIDNYINIYTTDLARHPGKWSDTSYRITYDSTVLYITEENVVIDGLQIQQINSSADYRYGIRLESVTGENNYTISNNIIKGNMTTTGSYCYGITGNSGSSGTVVNIYNNILYDIPSTAIFTNGSGRIYYVYNNTIHNSNGNGISQVNGSTLYATNNLISSTTNPFNGTFESASTHNATDISATPTGGAATTIQNATFNFVSTTPGSEDFHLQETSTDVLDVGYDLSSDPYLNITDDIDGGVRPFNEGTFDIGADEYGVNIIYRSNGPANTTALQDDNSSADTVTIGADGTAIFSASLLDIIGVGDAIVYDSDGDETIDSDDAIVFISARISSTEYTVQDEDGTPPDATVTTEGDWSIYRAYISLANAEAGIINTGISALGITFDAWTGGRDLVTNNEQWNIACYGDATDTSNVAFMDWTTSEANYTKIYTPVESSEVGISQRHSGVWEDSKYHIITNGSSIQVQIDFIKIIGLQVEINPTGTYQRGILTTNGTDGSIVASNIVRRGESSFTYAHGIEISAQNTSAYINSAYNNIVYGFDAVDNFGIQGQGNTDMVYVFNNTVYDSTTCYATSFGDVVAKNNIAQNCDTDFGASFSSLSDSNISSDDTAPGTNPIINTNVKFVDAYNKNFHLDPSDTSAIDAGTSTEEIATSLSLLAMTRDIDGQLRRTFDIGADEASIDFTTIVMEGGLGDFTTLASWENFIEADLVASTTAVFDTTGKTGTFTQGNIFVGATSYATGTLVAIASSSGQVLLIDIEGSFINGETVSDGSASFVLEDMGNPVNAVAEIDGVWSAADGTNVVIGDWETGANNHIRVYTTDTARHKGKWDDTKYVLSSDHYFATLYIYEQYVRIDGLQIESTNPNGSPNYAAGIGCAENDDITEGEKIISNNIIRDTNTTNQSAGITLVSWGLKGQWKIFNNIIYGFGQGMDLRGGNSTEFYVYNNTIYNAIEYGMFFNEYTANRVVEINNNIVQSITDSFIIPGVTPLSSYSYSNNISSDGTAPGTDSLVSTIVTFMDATNDDFRLSPNDTTAKNAGTSTPMNLSGDTIYDIQGTLRGANWDIGADEVAQDYVSTICENTSAGGDCADMDYSSLFDWEDAVEVDLTATTTRVFSGSITGVLSENNTVTLYENGAITSITASLVATTSDQILLDNIDVGIASATDAVIVNGQLLSVGASSVWLKDASNYWTMTSTTTADLLGASPVMVAKIDGVWASAETGGLNLNNSITDIDNYIKIYTTDLARHPGKWSDTSYRIIYSASVLYVTEKNVVIDGLQIQQTNSSSDYRYGIRLESVTGENNYTISNNIIKGNITTTGSYCYGITGTVGSSGTIVNIYNNILYDIPSTAIVANGSGRIFYVYNNTIHNSTGSGITQANGSVTYATNNLISSTTNPFSGTFESASTHNSTDISATPTGGAATTIQNATFNFVSTTPGSEDFHLLSTDTGAKDMGANLATDPYLNISSDIDGELRPYDGGYDIGADEYFVTALMSDDETVDITTDLVAHWKFDEIGNSTVTDHSGSGNDGTWSGSGANHYYPLGRFGTAGMFNGTDDYVNAGSAEVLDMGEDSFTLSAWVKTESTSAGNENGIIYKKLTATDEHSGYSINIQNGAFRFVIADGTNSSEVIAGSSGDYNDNGWHHVVAVRDYANVLVVYVDGVRVAETADATVVSIDNNISLSLGAMSSGALSHAFDGSIDDVRIYRRNLTGREVAELFGNSRLGVEWHFRNNLNDTGQTCKVGNCKTLTAVGTVQYDQGYLEAGITALRLDGTNSASLADDDYFDISSTSDFSLTATLKTTDTGDVTIVSKRTDASAGSVGYHFGLDYGQGDGIPYFEISDGVNEYSIYGSVNVSDGKWHTIMVVFNEDDAGRSKIYIDGTDKTAGRAGTLSAIDSLANAVAFDIGQTNDGNGSFTGQIDRVAFYPYVLTKDDVLKETANSYNVQYGQQDRTNTNGIAYDPLAGAAPVAHWNLNEMSGPTARDYASSSLDGTWSGTGTHHKNGKVGMGGEFNGVDDYVDVDDPIFAFDENDNFTLEAWIKPIETPGTNTIIGKDYGTFRLNIVSNRLVFACDGNNINLWSPNELILNKWQHVVARYEDTKTASIFIDGVLVNSDTDPTLDWIPDAIMRIGKPQSDDYYFKGQIDEVKIYNYARTQAQVAWDYNRGKPVAHWKFDEASSGDADGAILIDSSGNENTGTGSSTGSGLDYVPGKFGNALDFDGVDDFVDVGTDVVYHDEVTYSAWIKPTTINNDDTMLRKQLDTLRLKTDGRLEFTIEGTDWNGHLSTASIDTNIWTHVAATFVDSSDVLKYYINGNLDSEISYTASMSTSGPGVYPLYVGANSYLSQEGTNPFDGLIDDVRVYNYALPADMIKEVYNGGNIRFGE